MKREDARRGVLALDAIGCAATAAVVVAVPSVLRPVDPPLTSRWPFVAALTLTAGMCAYGARTPEPSETAMTAAAIINGGWVAACVVALRCRSTDLGSALIGATAVLDGAVGGLQWTLRHEKNH